MKAVETLIKEKIANPVLGDEEAVRAKAQQVGADIGGVEIVNPAKAPYYGEFVEQFYEMRKSKGMTPKKRNSSCSIPVFRFHDGKTGKADGEVAGAINTTGDVLRPALQIIRTAPEYLQFPEHSS